MHVVYIRCGVAVFLPVYWCETAQLEQEGQVRNDWIGTNKENIYGSEPTRGSVYL
jgi:hypothetical protein